MSVLAEVCPHAVFRAWLYCKVCSLSETLSSPALSRQPCALGGQRTKESMQKEDKVTSAVREGRKQRTEGRESYSEEL